MACVLLVDDDPEQLELRQLIFEREGYQVLAAPGSREALEAFDQAQPSLVVLDLRIPSIEDGLALIRQIRERSGEARIVVLSGWAADLAGRPESLMVQDVLPKAAGSRKLLARAAKLASVLLALALAPAPGAPAQTTVIELKEPREVVAEFEFRSTGASWNQPGREAALVEIRVGGKIVSHLPLFGGDRPHRYPVLLGRLEAGSHQLEYRRDARSPQGLGFTATAPPRIRQYAPGDPNYEMIAHAPVLFARNDSQRFSDVPLLVYCETFQEGPRRTLQYTVIFSNEDGGTSTRALMARWGRTTDIEMVYRVTPGGPGVPAQTLIQTRGHKEIEFTGEYEASHPLLGVVTDNNMVSPEGRSAIRWAPAPRPANLSAASREKVMDEAPWTYRVMSEELEREGKLREFGVTDGQKISRPRNYLYIEARIANADTRMTAAVRLRNSSYWQFASLGRFDYAIERSGWVRMAVELPPGATGRNIAEAGFACLLEPGTRERPAPPSSSCTLHAVSRMFLLDSEFVPGPNLWPHALKQPVVIPSGQMYTVLLHGN